MTVARCKAEMPSSEFTDWCVYFNQKWNEPDATQQYLAQIAYEVAKSSVEPKHRKRIKFETFLLKFKDRAKKMDPRLAMQASKVRMLAMVGLLDKLKPKD